MKKLYPLFCLLALLLLSGVSAFAVPVYTIQNVKDACGGQANGSFDVVITSASPNGANHLRIQVFGPPDSFFDLGVPALTDYPITVSITNLPGAVAGFSYVIIVRDGANVVQNQDIFDYPDITIVSTSKTDNTVKDCVSPAPDGTLNANVTGGSPSGVTYTWNGPGGPYVSVVSPAVSGLAGGSYTLTVTDNATACSATSAPVVIADPIPAVKTITPTGNVDICPGADFSITVQNSETDPDGVTYEVLVNGAPSSPLVSGLGTGSDLTLTLLSGNFADNDVVTVRAHYSSCTTYQPMTGSATIKIQNLASSAAITPNSRCVAAFDGAIDLTVTGAIGTLDYAWTGPGLFSAVTQDITAVEDGNYQVIITDLTTTCNITSNFTVGSTKPTLSTSIVVTANSNCVGFNGAIDLTVLGSLGGFSFSWSGPNSFTSTSEDITGLEDGNYSVTVTDIPSGCTTNAVIAVANTRPTIDATSVVTNRTSCVTLNGAIDITPSGGSGTYSYAWTGTGVVPGNQDQVGLDSGPYSVTITEAPSGCFVIKNFTINNNAPAITAPGVVTDNTACAVPNGAIDITPAGGAGPYTFVWTGPSITVATAGNEDQIALAAGSYSVTVTETGSGCNVVSNFTVADTPPAINATLSGSTTICAGSATDISVSITGGTAPYTVDIDNGVGTKTNYNSNDPISVSPASTITYNLVTVTDANGCTATLAGSATITVTPVPTPALTGLATPCINTTQTYNTDTGMSNYLWTVSAGGNIVGGGDGFDFIDIDWTATGSQTVTVQYDAASCTTPITTLNVDVKEISITTTVTPNTKCTPLNGAIDITVSGLVGVPTFLWDDPAASTTEDISGLDAGDYTVTITDPVTGCSFTSAAITVADGRPTLNFTLGTVSDNTGCTPSTFDGSIDITVTGASGSLGYAWTGPNGFTSNVEDPSSLEDGDYDVTITDLGSGCTLIPSTITVGNAQPVIDPNPTVSDNTKCAGPPNGAISLLPTGGNGSGLGYTFAWTDGGTFSSTSQDISGLPAASYDVVVTDVATGCTGSSTGNVVADVPPTVGGNITGTTAICIGQSATLTFALFGGGSTFDVVYTDGTTNFPLSAIPNGHQITVSPTLNTNYQLVSVLDITNQCLTSAPDPNINSGGPASITINPLPADATNPVGNTFCSGNPTTAISVDDPGVGFTVNWFAASSGGVSIGTGPSFAPPAAGTYFAEVSDNTTSCISATRTAATLTQTSPPTGSLSGNATICVGQSATLSVTLTGVGPWNIVYTDGTTNFPINGIATSPHTFSVSPVISSTYSLVSVADAVCGNGTGSGTASITVNPIAGNPATFGSETWLGYVYDDQSNPAPPATNIDFDITKYRGFIDETEIAGLGFSSYNTTTDAFNLNLANLVAMQGANICGSYLNDYSIRFRMNKTFAAGIYTFTLGADDGVRMFIDGNPVTLNPANSFTTHSYTTYNSDAQCIAAGPHDVVIEYFERGGFSRVSFDYQAAPAPTVSTPVTVCVNSAIPTLTASSTDPGVTGYNWYTDAALTNLVANTQNYTPAPADLDMTVAATSDFFVVATYACGQTQPAQVDVTVVNAASITLPPAPTQVCQTNGIVDLTTLVSATPGGGTFTFSGTGITTSPNFDPTLVTGTSTITVNYSSGGCTANTTFDIDVITTATVTVPSSNVTVCQDAGVQDLTLLVSATPIGGAYTFTGTGVTGTSFDPSGQSGIVPITVDYVAGGCTDSKIFNFDVITTATLTVDNTTVTCPGAAPIDLTTLVTASPSGGTFTFSGATGITGNMFDPSLHANSTVVINVAYLQGGCTAASTVTIAVLAINDPLCTGGGGTGTCATVVITPVPSPATCTNSDGSIIFNIVPAVPVVNNTGVKIDIVGTSPTNSSISRTNFNDPNFTNLPAGNYNYSIEYGDPSCIKTGTVAIDQSGTVGTPVASNPVNPVCFGQPVGSVTLDVPGETGNLLEWSLDGIVWTQFTAGNQITGIPAGNNIISVRRTASDPCNAAVSVTLTDANPDITTSIATTAATCNNNDGTLTVSAIGGGSGVANFTYELNGTAYATLPAGGVFSALSAGTYVFSVIDNVGCRKDFTSTVTFPGFVNTTTPVATDTDCTGGGANGSIQFTITDVGSFQVGYTTDPNAPPASFSPAGGSVVTIPNLTNGIYYIWIQASGAQCATKLPGVTISGPYAPTFSATANNVVCFGAGGEIDLSSITGAPNLPFTYELVNSGNTSTGSITASEALGTLKISGLTPGSYQIRISQDQSTLFAACTAPITTPYQNLTITGPTAALDTLYVAKTISYPDLPTASVLIGIQESLQEPYEVRMELIAPLFPSESFLQDWTVATRNTENLKMEMSIKNLYAGGYQLSLRDELGCVKNYAVTIDVDKNIFVPNIFTPNGDGKNDMFYIRNLPADSQLIITNRWGKEVFNSKSYQNDWDGGDVADGIYYYKLALPDQSLNGWVEILRGQ